MRLASLKYGDKFILSSNYLKYKRYGSLRGRIKVKAVGHCCSPLLNKDLSDMTFAPQCKVLECN